MTGTSRGYVRVPAGGERREDLQIAMPRDLATALRCYLPAGSIEEVPSTGGRLSEIVVAAVSGDTLIPGTVSDSECQLLAVNFYP